MRTLILGAGKTGRGFIGRLCQQTGIPVVFADIDEKLVDSLERRGEYTVSFFADRSPTKCDSFVAVKASPDAILPWWSDIDVVFVSVGVENLGDVGSLLVELARRDNDTSVRTVFLCENAVDPVSRLTSTSVEEGFLRDRYHIRRGAVFCTNIADPASRIDLISEEYERIECEAASTVSDQAYPFLEMINDFDLLIRRKLYTYNAATGILGFLGWMKGYEYLHQAACDPDISALCDRFYKASNRAIASEYGISLSEQTEFAMRSWEKFTNRKIADPIARNIRNPKSKLKADERLIAPLRLIDQLGLDTEPLVVTIAVAALYSVAPNGAWTSSSVSKATNLLVQESGLKPVETIGRRIFEIMERLIVAQPKSDRLRRVVVR